MVEVAEPLETKLKRHEDALVACMAEITRLREENARLHSSENTAHSVLKEIYNDPAASPNVRVLAARAAIGHESAPLKAVEPALELTAERKPLPLAEVVRLQRARADALTGLPMGHEKYRDWVWDADETKWAEQVSRLESSADGNGGNGDGQS